MNEKTSLLDGRIWLRFEVFPRAPRSARKSIEPVSSCLAGASLSDRASGFEFAAYDAYVGATDMRDQHDGRENCSTDRRDQLDGPS